MVTSSESVIYPDGNGENRPVRVFRYTERLESDCGYYLSLGMSYDDYWNGDVEMTKFYRDKDEREKERQNYYLWLQGAYIYEAFLDASPAFNALSKRKKPYEYRSTPISITQRSQEATTKTNEFKKMDDTRTAFITWAESFNEKFKHKEGVSDA